MKEGAHEGEPQFETECGGKQPSPSSGGTDQMAAAQTHFTAPRAQLPQVTTSGPQKTATHGAASSPEQELCTSQGHRKNILQVV